MQMKAFKYFMMPVVLISCLFSNAYASTPAYVKSIGLNAQQSGLESFFMTIYYLVMFALILAAAYYVTKFLAQKGIAQGKAKTMKVIESMPLGVDKSLHLVKVGAQYFLIGSASKNMFMMSELEEDKLFQQQEDGAISLNEIEFENYEDSLEVKDFAYYLSSVKQNLNKLKSIVRGNNGNE